MTPAKGEPQPDLFGWRASFKGVYLGTFNDADAAADAIRAHDLAHSVSPIYQQTLNAADPLKGKVA